jgi:hypothetical protein
MSLPQEPIEDNADPAVSVGAMTLLASLLIGALLYLGAYSMGPEFQDRAPQFNGNMLAGSVPGQ